jgi:hypothetical protein
MSPSGSPAVRSQWRQPSSAVSCPTIGPEDPPNAANNADPRTDDREQTPPEAADGPTKGSRHTSDLGTLSGNEAYGGVSWMRCSLAIRVHPPRWEVCPPNGTPSGIGLPWAHTCRTMQDMPGEPGKVPGVAAMLEDFWT